MSPSELISNFLTSLFSKIAFNKEKGWVLFLAKLSSLVFYSGVLIAVLNLLLFLSLSVRLKRFDSVIIMAVLIVLYPVLFHGWKNIVDLMEKGLVFRGRFALPDPLRVSVEAVLLVSSVATLVAGLFWGISGGNILPVAAGILGAFFFYQWFSAIVNPSTIGISFDNVSSGETPLVFPDWLILKFLMFYLFVVELSIVGMIVTPLVMVVDLIRAWSAKAPGVVYETALAHQGMWIGSLVIPVMGYFVVQGWIFGWDLLRKIWIKAKEDVDEAS